MVTPNMKSWGGARFYHKCLPPPHSYRAAGGQLIFTQVIIGLGAQALLGWKYQETLLLLRMAHGDLALWV